MNKFIRNYFTTLLFVVFVIILSVIYHAKDNNDVFAWHNDDRNTYVGSHLWQLVDRNKTHNLLLIFTRAWLEPRAHLEDAPYIIVTLLYELSAWENEKKNTSENMHTGYFKIHGTLYKVSTKLMERMHRLKIGPFLGKYYVRDIILFQIPVEVAEELAKSDRHDFMYVYKKVSTIPNKIDLMVPPNPGKVGGVTICVPPMYGSLSNHRERFFIEWVEIYKILGVNTINLYNMSLSASPTLQRIFDHYIEEGTINLENYHAPFKLNEDERNVNTYVEDVAVSECLFRNMHIYDYVLVVDIDEVLFLYKHDTCMEFLTDITTNNPSLVNDSQSISFFQDSFVQPDTFNFSKIYSSLEHYPPTGPNTGLGKSFLDTNRCAYAMVHMCGLVSAPYKRATKIGRDIGMIHHYRTSCKHPRFCSGKPRIVTDESIGRFKPKLLDRLQIMYDKIGIVLE